MESFFNDWFGKHKNVFPITRPTRPPIQVVLIVRLFIEDHIEKNEVNRSTLREVLKTKSV